MSPERNQVAPPSRPTAPPGSRPNSSQKVKLSASMVRTSSGMTAADTVLPLRQRLETCDQRGPARLFGLQRLRQLRLAGPGLLRLRTRGGVLAPDPADPVLDGVAVRRVGDAGQLFLEVGQLRGQVVGLEG